MASFTPPEASAGLCEGVPFDSASDTAIDNKAAFDAFDQTPTGQNDPSQCKALLAFPDGTIFWSSKMAIDADGPAAGVGRLSGSQLDPGTGQDDTSFHFSDTDEALPSEAVPYIVLPGATFRTNTGLAVGDVALVIFKDKIAAAICGDIGPSKKIGEGSIRLHEALHPPAPDPCSLRQPDGSCKRILNASIEEDVLFFVFPQSSFGEELTASNLETLVNERAFALFNKFRGAT
jgi:glycosyl hydrolase group 75 (putative chitosanase)